MCFLLNMYDVIGKNKRRQLALCGDNLYVMKCTTVLKNNQEIILVLDKIDRNYYIFN